MAVYNRRTELALRPLHYLVVAVIGLIILFPFIWMVLGSLKFNKDILDIPVKLLPPEWNFGSYPNAFAAGPFGRYYLNSGIVLLAAVGLNIVVCATSGYGFAKYRFRGRNLFFTIILSTLMVPIHAVIVPLFVLMKNFGLVNTYLGIILPLSLSGFGVFLMRQFFYAVPDELIEAARIDGAGELHIFLRVSMPISRVAIVTLVIFHSQYVWKNLIWPLVVISGTDLRTLPVLTENAGLDDRLTARENLEYTARMRGYSIDEARTRVDAQLARFAMGEMADLRTAGFSTGQRKRLALARALLHDPEILFLDEPTSGLDPAATREVTDLIGTLAREHGRTVILATHFLGEAGRVADRMAVLDRGRLRALGKPDDLAAELWDGIPADLDFGGPVNQAVLDLVDNVDGVLRTEARATGATIAIRDREAMARILAVLAAHEIDVFGAAVRQASMEDVYFALESGFAAEQR